MLSRELRPHPLENVNPNIPIILIREKTSHPLCRIKEVCQSKKGVIENDKLYSFVSLAASCSTRIFNSFNTMMEVFLTQLGCQFGMLCILWHALCPYISKRIVDHLVWLSASQQIGLISDSEHCKVDTSISVICVWYNLDCILCFFLE